MMKQLLQILIVGLVMVSGMASGKTAEVKDFAKVQEGQAYFLKVAVAKVQYLFNGTDATNIYPGSKISYRATVGMRQTQSENAEDFAEEVRIHSAQDEHPPQVRVLAPGSRIRITKVKVRDNEVKIEFKEIGGSKHALRLKFDNKRYDVVDVEDLFYTAFAESEAELNGAEQTIFLNGGMSLREVIRTLGRAEIQVELAEKTVLIYPNMKLTFNNDALVDVQ